jgi:hypothetical protein
VGTMWLVDRSRVHLRVAGQAALLAQSVLAVQIFSLSFLRADSVPSWKGMHLESWAALVLVVSFLLGFIVLNLREKLHRPGSEALRQSD